MVEHSPTPWRLSDAEVRPACSIYGADSWLVAHVVSGSDFRKQDAIRADAEHIIRCVNSHDELVRSLEAACLLLEDLKYFTCAANYRAALKLARGE